MKRYTCTRRIQFCAGHRVTGHETKCKNLHGHNYVAFITAEAKELDSLGRVIDFGVLKTEVGGWIDEHWDHGMILWCEDPIRVVLKKSLGKRYLLPTIPTAENMALYLKAKATELLKPHGVSCTNVVLWETENCYAEA